MTKTQTEIALETVADQQTLRILLEDLLVARQRFAWALRRAGKSRSKDAQADRDHHRAHLDLYGRLLAQVGGEKSVSAETVRAARRSARARTKHDLQLGCLCGAIAGATKGECPARGQVPPDPKPNYLAQAAAISAAKPCPCSSDGHALDCAARLPPEAP